MTCHSEELEFKIKAASVLAVAGWTYADAAKAVGLPMGTANMYLKGVAARRVPDTGRALRMAEMYRSGKTLTEIGAEFGITRERVRQLISAIGVTRQMGGITARTLSRGAALEAAKIERRNKKSWRSHGCDYATAVSLNEGRGLLSQSSRSHLYHRQKRSAYTRSIVWNMTFPEWCSVWDESGKWAWRGRGRGHYCMSRIADAGAYEVGNVRIISNEENIAEGFRVRPASERQKLNNHIQSRIEKQKQALELHSSGKTNAEIATALNLSRRYIPQLLVNARHAEDALKVAA